VHNAQTEEVEEEVEDVDVNSGDEEEEEFVPGTQEREAAPNLFVSSSTLRTEGHRPPREDNDDEIEDISTRHSQPF
jgi:hypothetical protein